MKTYTIAYSGLLYACVPDGDETALKVEIAEQRKQAEQADVTFGPVTIERGLILTNDEPENPRRIVWCGWLADENGTAYEYAIRAS